MLKKGQRKEAIPTRTEPHHSRAASCLRNSEDSPPSQTRTQKYTPTPPPPPGVQNWVLCHSFLLNPTLHNTAPSFFHTLGFSGAETLVPISHGMREQPSVKRRIKIKSVRLERKKIKF